MLSLWAQLQRPGDRTGFILGPGEIRLPLSAIINLSPSHASLADPFTIKQQLKMRDYALSEASNYRKP